MVVLCMSLENMVVLCMPLENMVVLCMTLEPRTTYDLREQLRQSNEFLKLSLFKKVLLERFQSSNAHSLSTSPNTSLPLLHYISTQHAF